MQIEILNTTLEDKGKYKQLDVAFKNDGKTQGKKVMSFGGNAKAFLVLSDAKPGDVFDVKAEKNKDGYWDWVDVSKATSKAVGQPAPAARGSYETAEERAKRQVLIVRQSCLSTAVEFLKGSNPKGGFTVDDLETIATQLEDHVFGSRVSANPFEDMKDDIPF